MRPLRGLPGRIPVSCVAVVVALAVTVVLAALMFVERLTGRTPIGLPAPGGSGAPALFAVRVGQRQLRQVQEAAAEANSKFRPSR